MVVISLFSGSGAGMCRGRADCGGYVGEGVQSGKPGELARPLSMPIWAHLVFRNTKSEDVLGRVGEMAADCLWLAFKRERPCLSNCLERGNLSAS
jgi:hypothetical protein